MDRPRQNPPSPAFILFERRIAPLLFVMAVVFGVSLIPIAFLFWSGLGVDRPVAAARPLVPWQPAPPPPVRTVLFRDVHVVDVDGDAVLRNRDVLVSEGRIAAVHPTGTASPPADAQVIQAAGSYLAPGLADMHVHLSGSDRDQAAMLELLVANGVTSVLNLHGRPSHLALRDRIGAGEQLGPTIFTSGPYISNAPFYSPEPDEAAEAVRDHQRAGYDVIKIHGDFSRDAYRSLMQAARRARIKVVGHAPRNIGMDPIFEERQDALAHVEEYIYAHYRFGGRGPGLPPDLEELTRTIVERTRAAGMQVIANLTAYHGIWKQAQDVRPLLARPEMQYVPADIRDDWEPERNTYVQRFGGNPRPFEEWYGVLETLVKALDDAGVPIRAGTDTPIPSVVPGFSLHDELQDLVEAGLSPVSALRSATSAPGRFLSAAGELGTIAVGRRADLVLVDRNPLEDIAALRRPRGVMVRGRWLDRAVLDARLAALAGYAAAGQ